MIYFHLPGLFEFYDFYSVFLPLFREHREYFYDWCEIGSIYGAPADCLWGGGRAGFGECNAKVVLKLMNEYNISPRLTFSNSLLREEHLSDKRCNDLCEMFYKESKAQSGIIVHSDLLLNYLKNKYPNFYFVSSTTKVITDFEEFKSEVDRKEFSYVVPDFRLNKDFENLHQFKHRDNFISVLNTLTFEDFLQAIKNSEAIARDCEDHGRRNQIYGFYFYENNPATSVGAVFKLILKDCGFLFSSKK